MPYYTCDMITNKAGFFIDVFWGRNLAIKYEKHVNYKSNQQEQEDKEEKEKKVKIMMIVTVIAVKVIAMKNKN